jgi:formiminoglutamase
MNLDELLSYQHLKTLTRQRSQETKLGEEVQYLTNQISVLHQLQTSSARFVIVGIPEDIGVRANYGRGGAHTAFKPALESFLNQQSNAFLMGNSILILGEIKVDDLMEASKEASNTQLKELVTQVDERVTVVIKSCVECGKIPIIIGGGHNNAFGNIKGSSLAKGKKINAINCDPHADFRPLEGRHSGNGFSYAHHQEYLNKYAVFGLHEQYNTKLAIDTFLKNPSQLYFQSYESIFVKEQLPFSNALQQCISYVNDGVCGVEIDIDAITNVPSSAKTSSGLSPVQARQYVYQCGLKLEALYFHIAEAAPILSHIKADNKTGKLIAYLVSDFIKAVNERFEKI